MKDLILLPRNRFLWNVLAFQGGFVNVAGLLTVHMFVAHITGFSAHFGVAMVQGSVLNALYFLLVPFFFLLGSFFTSLFTELRRNEQRSPVYVYNLGFLVILYLALAVLGSFQFFGEFGEPFENFRDFVLMSLLAFSCGSQNALFTHYSGSIIRTTHLTGITTDLGIGIAKFWIGGDRREGKVNRLRIELIVFFTLGSFLGAWIFPRLEFLGFALPAVLSALVGFRLSSSAP